MEYDVLLYIAHLCWRVVVSSLYAACCCLEMTEEAEEVVGRKGYGKYRRVTYSKKEVVQNEYKWRELMLEERAEQ